MKNTKGLTKKLLAGLFCALVSGSGYASAMPTGAHDLQNISGITQNGNIMDIAGKGNAVAKWQDFSLKQGETVNFEGMTNVLNIVDGKKFSEIRGNINGKGVNVFLVNPSGVLFGDTSKVSVGSLTVSTQELSKNLAEEFAKNGTLVTDSSKLGVGNVTFVGNINADTVKVTGNNISLVNTDNLNAKNVSLTTPNKGFINVLKGQDTSKLTINGGTLRNDMESIDSMEKLKNIKHNGHYMLTKDIDVDASWKGISTDATETYKDKYTGKDYERNVTNGLILDGTGHSISGMDNNGLFKVDTKAYNTEISNLTVKGDTFTNKNNRGAAVILDAAENLTVNNLTSDFKKAITKSGENGVFGLFGDVYDSKFVNVTNNTDFSFESTYTGNLLRYAYNTDFYNYTNNGKGYAGIAYYVWGGDIINSTNNGDMTKAGFVDYFYNNKAKGFSEQPTYRDVRISGNTNNGSINSTSSDVSGLISYVKLGGNDKSFVFENNTNNGKIKGNYMSVSGLMSELYAEDTHAILQNNVNNGDVFGQYAGGLFGRVMGDKVTLKGLRNNGNINSEEGNYYYYQGGIASQIIAGDVVISNTENHGTIGYKDYTQSQGTYVGGIVGDLYSDWKYKNATAKIENVRNYGTVAASTTVGGLFGRVSFSSGATIKNSFNVGDIVVSNGYSTPWYNGGLVGITDTGTFVFENVYNTGNIVRSDNRAGGNCYTGGLIGYVSAGNGTNPEKETVTIKNAFNSGNITDAEYSTGGLIGGVAKSMSLENDYNAGNIAIKDTIENPHTDSHGTIVGDINRNVDVSLKNVYNSGSISRISGGERENTILGKVSKAVSLSNVYSTSNDSLYNSKYNDSVAISGEVNRVEGKKASNFSGFNLDATGKNKSATWRIYEGYTNPLLTVFMNDVNLDDTTKTVTYTGREQSFSKGDLTTKNNFGTPNFFTEHINYAKDSHISDGKDGKEFKAVTGTEVSKYQTKVYSDQLGFNFHTVAGDDTLTLEIEAAPEPSPAPVPIPEPTPSPIPTPGGKPTSLETPVVNLKADKIIKINVVNQTGSYTDLDSKEHTLLNEKESARTEQTDELNIIEIKE